MSSEKNKFPKLFDDTFYDFVRSVDSYFDKSFKQLHHILHRQMFHVEVYETDSHVVVEAELPGYKREQIQIELLGNRMRIAVKQNTMTEVVDDKNNNYHNEQSQEHIERTVTLPHAINEKDVKATFQDGLLKVITPKSNRPTRYIDID
ncbi:Hsp20/alpha crystallin family protein [Thalassobacillus pellis]|uniref:Hsp20/alpha crystallin family protein n=1 Tax=Thalassobacillus pellis TaxID=748008 RepID=UPI001960E00F|nr:Hsp20/alpha crystallin family protein [Thalassobacillus pellis]MBM7553529.1 HSP20 family protein [Thalassobacillus pellis]